MIYKIIFEGLRYLILIITIVGMVTDNIYFNRIVLFIFSLFITSYLISKLISTKKDLKIFLSKAIVLIGIITSMVLSYYSSRTNMLFILFTIIYLLIWIKGIKLKNQIYYNKDIFQKFILTLIIGLLFSLDILIGNTRWYVNDIIPYILIFIIISFIFSIRVNLYNAYASDNHINKSKNLKIFNVISNIFIIMIIGSIIYFSFEGYNIKLINSNSDKIIDVLLAPLIFIVSIIYNFLSKIISKINPELKTNDSTLELTNNNENLLEVQNQNETMELAFNYLGWALVIGIIIVLAYILYRMSKNIENNKKDNENIILEEKEFIFDRHNIVNNFKNKFIRSKAGQIKNENLHKVRLIFIQISQIMLKQGYNYRKEFTPREFILQNKEDEGKAKKFIEEYEKVRYGNKDIDEEDMKKIYEYKDVMDKK
ncbi:hypothetical protein [Senegalia massiliensis]|uniref:hypothetical protein n=1 Tax=Senegalia massiliensis TaxID=1720316 RepID=UPI0010314E15|nr:hypothetical protein [Senegalia massiliensis]